MQGTNSKGLKALLAREWNNSGYQISLSAGDGKLSARLKSEKGSITLGSENISCGPLGKVLHGDFIQQINEYTQEKIRDNIALFPYFTQGALKELWLFEAIPSSAPKIRRARALIKEASVERVEKGLNNLKTALKIQKYHKRNTANLEQAILQLKKDLFFLQKETYTSLYLTHSDAEGFNEAIKNAKKTENIFEGFLQIVDSCEEEKLSCYMLLMKAIAHEFLEHFFLAMESYLLLSEKSLNHPTQYLNAIKKAKILAQNQKDPFIYLHFLEKIVSLPHTKNEDLLNLFQKKDLIRMSFEASLLKLSSYSKEKQPICFISYCESEPDVEKWLKEALVPDLGKGGIRSLFHFEEIQTDRNRSNFHSLIRQSDQVIIACTPNLKKTCEAGKKAPTGVVMQLRIACERYNDKDKFGTIFPLYFKGDRSTSCPTEAIEPIQGLHFGQFIDSQAPLSYYEGVIDLIASMRKIPWRITDSIKEEFLSRAEEILSKEPDLSSLQTWRGKRKEKSDSLYASIVKRISNLTQMVNLPEVPKDFTGRKQELNDLHETLKKEKKVAISGLGGIGKTALALAYAHEHLLDYQWIHFISGTSEALIIDGLLKLADDLSVPKVEKTEERLELLKVQLNRLEDDYLLIFDGVDNEEDIDSLEKYLPGQGNCLLLTSRLSKKTERLNFTSIALAPLTLADATDYLLKVTGSDDRQNAEILAETLGRLPLALTHAAYYIKGNGSIKIYNKDFKEFKLKLFRDSLIPLKKEEKTILKTWQISMNAIEKKLESSFSKDLMNFLAFLAPSSIPLECLELWVKNCDYDRLDLIEAKSALLAYSMINEGSGEDTYQVHQLVQMVARYQLENPMKQTLIKQGIKVFSELGEKYDPKNPENREQTQLLLPHCETIIGYDDQVNLSIKSQEYLNVLNYAFFSHSYFGRYSKKKFYADRALAVAKEMYPDLNNSVVATALDNVGLSLGELGRYEKALKYRIEALELRKKLLGNEHPHVAMSLNNVGSSLGELGRHEEALKYFVEALELVKKLLGNEHPHVATSLNNVGSSLGELGRHQEALKYLMEALELRKKNLGNEHPGVATSLNNVGSSLGELGRHQEALKYLMEALELWKKLLGNEHPTVATSLNNVGGSLAELGKHQEALKYEMEALELSKKLLGNEHPHVAKSLNNVGSSLMELGKHEEALKYHMEALELSKKLLGNEHPDVATSLNNVGGSLGKLGRHQEALKYKMEALELRKKLLGDKHPHVAASLNNVGSSLSELGRHQEALKYKMEALELNKKLLGNKHPHVAASLNNVGSSLEKLGRHEEALKYLMEALELRKKLLENEHPHVAASLNNVGSSLGNLGRHQEALKYEMEALELWKKLLRNEHPDVANSLNNVGGSYRELGKIALALRYCKQAVLILQVAHFNSSHPTTKMLQKNLETLEKEADEKSKELVSRAIQCQNRGEALGLYEEAIIILLELHDEKFPVLSDRFLALEIVQKIPVFKLFRGKEKS